MTDYRFYSDIYSGSRTEEEIAPLLTRAEEQILCCICREPLTEEEINCCCYAGCIQADYLFNSHEAGGYSSVKLGDFSLSGGQKSDDSVSTHSGLPCVKSLSYLESKGLLYRGGVGV